MSRHQVSGIAFGCVLAGAGLVVPSAAQAEKANCSDSVFTVQLENDFFTRATNTDRHYTNGLRVAVDISAKEQALIEQLHRDGDASGSELLRAQRNLPAELTELPSYRKINPADAPILFMHMTSPSMDMAELNDYAENLVSPAISTLPGIAQVTVTYESPDGPDAGTAPEARAAAQPASQSAPEALRHVQSNKVLGAMAFQRVTGRTVDPESLSGHAP